ncbi:hypothetical protein B296_00009418 [Ensete ventricosum]|uniref:Dehydrogenase E1 component domain-containing protein n=1 Tax=Ensete ventricosum TaxID=4639 RepID=A0A427AVV2_ENSVE|nr:hypothetical protein B296_00009418 [Ensete ventricosum]
MIELTRRADQPAAPLTAVATTCQVLERGEISFHRPYLPLPSQVPVFLSWPPPPHRLSAASLRLHHHHRLLLLRPFASSTGGQPPIAVETSVPFTGHKIVPPSRLVDTIPSELLSFFRDMSVMRRMDIAADSLYKSKLIRGFCHLYDGQEAVAIGLEAVITNKDAVITAYHDHCT